MDTLTYNSTVLSFDVLMFSLFFFSFFKILINLLSKVYYFPWGNFLYSSELKWIRGGGDFYVSLGGWASGKHECGFRATAPAPDLRRCADLPLFFFFLILRLIWVDSRWFGPIWAETGRNPPKLAKKLPETHVKKIKIKINLSWFLI